MNSDKRNPLIDFINMLCNFFVLNLIFLITCIPIFTVGSALSSLYYVMCREAKGEYGYLVRTYMREFKRNLKNSTIAFLLLMIPGCLLVFNLLFWPVQGTAFSSIVTGLLIALLVVWLAIFHYTFPLAARFVNTPVNTIKNAWGLVLRNFKWTLLLLVIDIFKTCFCLFLPLGTVLVSLTALGFALTAYCQSFIFNKILLPYEKKTDSSVV